MDSAKPDSARSDRLPARARVLLAREAEFLGAAEMVRDRFLIHGADSDGSFALVEHLMPPHTLAAPLHRHSREDEYSYVLEGRVGALLGNETVVGGPGDLIFKPRRQWHTFWNAGDTPARLLEIIAPAGFEQAFVEMDALGDALTPEQLAEIATRYGCEVDLEGTRPLIEERGLRF